jgi:serine/threonine protein kinase
MSASHLDLSGANAETTFGSQTLVDAVLQRFQSDWNGPHPPSIVAALAATTATGELRQKMLRELVLIDLEHRWKLAPREKNAGTLPTTANANRPRLADYAQQIPELGSSATWPPAMIVREYQVRQLYDPSVNLDEYLQEFPSHAKSIQEVLARMQRDEQTVSIDPHITVGSIPAVPSVDRFSGKSTFVGVIGEYDILEEVARGGMGIVYKARHRKLGRLAAVKMILDAKFASPEQVQRFYAEAEAAAHLEHSGIVTVFEVGEHAGQHYLAMAYVDGQSLWQRVKAGPLAPQEAALIMQQVAAAVHYAHLQGVVHRDLKPQNILLTKDNVPRVTDFGLAKRMSAESNLTIDGQIIGTPSYMPPEQAAGRVSEAGPLADVYSLGATLYCLLTGRPPFQAATPVETLRQVLETEPATPQQLNSDTPSDLETICLKCLRKDPHKRYGNAAELAADLGRYLRHEPIKARPVGKAERVLRWCRRYPTVAALLASVALALVLGTTVSTYFAFVAATAAQHATEKESLANAKSREVAAGLENLKQKNQELSLARTREEGERLRAEAVSKFLISVFRKPHPSLSDRDLTVPQLLEQANRDLITDKSLDDATRAAMLASLGSTYMGLGKPAESIPLLEEAQRLYRSTLGARHRRTLATACDLALALRSIGKVKESLQLYQDTVSLMQAELPRDDQDTLIAQSNYAQTLHADKQSQAALTLLDEVRTKMRQSLGNAHFATLAASNNAATIYCDRKDHAKAIQIYSEALEGIRPSFGKDHPHVLSVTVNLASAMAADKDWQKAREALEPIFPKIQEQFGQSHPQTAFAARILAEIYTNVREPEKATALRREFDRPVDAVMGSQANLGGLSNIGGSPSAGMGFRSGGLSQVGPGGPSMAKGMAELGPSAGKVTAIEPPADSRSSCLDALEHLHAGRVREYESICASLAEELSDALQTECFLVAASAHTQEKAAGKRLVELASEIAKSPAEGTQPREPAEGNRLLAAAYYRAEEYQKAVDEFRKLHAKSRLRTWDHCFLAMCYFRLADRDRAMLNLDLARQKQVATVVALPVLIDQQIEDAATKCLWKEAEALLNAAK